MCDFERPRTKSCYVRDCHFFWTEFLIMFKIVFIQIVLRNYSNVTLCVILGLIKRKFCLAGYRLFSAIWRGILCSQFSFISWIFYYYFTILNILCYLALKVVYILWFWETLNEIMELAGLSLFLIAIYEVSLKWF